MQFSKLFALAISTMISVIALADAANTLISFATPGPDKYADNQTVLDGEWYALCWSADGNFEGITPDCKPVDSADAVVIVAPLAKGGCCPFTVFQIDSKSSSFKENGVYSVMLLDTRTADKSAVAASVDGKPASVNAVQSSEQFTAKASTAGSVESKGTAAGAAWGETTVPAAQLKQPKITGIVVEGAKVKITVNDMLPAVKYCVKMGKTADQLNSYSIETPKTGVESTTFDIDAGDAKFFQIVREPLTK